MTLLFHKWYCVKISGWSVTSEGLQTRFSELIDLENKLMDYKVALDSRAESLAGKETQLDQREMAIHQKEKELKQREVRADDQDAVFKEKDEEVQACEKQLRLKEELLSCREKRLKLEVDNLMTAFANGQHGANPLLAQSRLLSQRGSGPMMESQKADTLRGVVFAGNQGHGPHFQQVQNLPGHPGQVHQVPLSPPQQTQAHSPPKTMQPTVRHSTPARGMISRPLRHSFPPSAYAPGLPPTRILPGIRSSPRAEVSPVQAMQVSPQSAGPHEITTKVSAPTTYVKHDDVTRVERMTVNHVTPEKALPDQMPEGKILSKECRFNEAKKLGANSMSSRLRTHDLIQNLRKRVYNPTIMPDAGPLAPSAKQSRILPPV